MRVTLVEYIPDPDDLDNEAVIDHKPDWFMRLCGYKTERIRYVGSCTVWHEYHGGRRCGTLMESFLSDIWENEKRKLRRKKKLGKEA